MSDAALRGEKPADVRVEDDMRQLMEVRSQRPLVRNRNLAGTDAFFDEHHVLSHVAEHRGRRDIVAACPQISAQAFLLERLYPRKKSGQSLHGSIDAQRSYHR